jgi:branched-chain amino acid transport system ATP-binding protein
MSTGSTAPRPLRLERVSKRFGGLQVFKDVSFELSPGEILGVIGPNGAGKTTIINVVSGGLPPSGGHIFLGEEDVTGKPVHAMSRLGVVRSFQQTNTFRQATVRENLSRAIRFSGAGPRGWQRVHGLLDMLELMPRLDEPSETLPYGLQKMLGLVMAYAAGPRVLMLDEPAAGLERRERPRIDKLVHHARDALGCAILIVEHDMELIRRLCARIIVLEAGNVLASGPPDEVLSRPDVIEAYLGASEGEAA